MLLQSKNVELTQLLKQLIVEIKLKHLVKELVHLEHLQLLLQ
jgi:hypothetical protein